MTTTPKALPATQCWHCDKHYDMTSEACPYCGAANANHNLELAQAQQSGAAPIADSLASAGGVEVVAWWNTKWSLGATIRELSEHKPEIGPMEETPAYKAGELEALVRQSDHLAALSKEREVAQALRDTMRTFIEATMVEDWSDESDEAVEKRALEWCTRWHAMKSDLAREREVADGLAALLEEARDDVSECLGSVVRGTGLERYERRIAAYQDQLARIDAALTAHREARSSK